MLAVRSVFSYDSSLHFEQCTYLGYVLLEAPRKYVLHGPLLSINWLRLCPRLGGPCVWSPAIWRRLFIVLMTAAHIHPTSFPSETFSATYTNYFLSYKHIIHTYYTSHLYAHLRLLFYMSCSHIHFFGSSWQAGCPRLLVSDTNTILSLTEYEDILERKRASYRLWN